MQSLWLLFLLLQLPLLQAENVDFANSLGVARLGRDFICEYPLDEQRFVALQDAWQRNGGKAKDQAGIPKVIYHLWLQEEPLSSKHKRYLASWQKAHPNWQIELWTRAEVEELDRPIRDKVLKADSLQEKEDLLRAYLLESRGGVCVDINAFNVRPLDQLVEKYDFFACIEPPLAKKKFEHRLHIATSFVGAAKGHPIILAWKDEIAKVAWSFHDKNRGFRTYLAFGNVVEKHLQSDRYRNIVLPPTYAFPIRDTNIFEFEKEQKKRSSDFQLFSLKQLFQEWFRKEPAPFSTLQPETVSVHMKGGTWGDPKQTKVHSNLGAGPRDTHL